MLRFSLSISSRLPKFPLSIMAFCKLILNPFSKLPWVASLVLFLCFFLLFHIQHLHLNSAGGRIYMKNAFAEKVQSKIPQRVLSSLLKLTNQEVTFSYGYICMGASSEYFSLKLVGQVVHCKFGGRRAFLYLSFPFQVMNNGWYLFWNIETAYSKERKKAVFCLLGGRNMK